MPAILLLGALLSAAPEPPGVVVVAPEAWSEALAPWVAARSAELQVESVALEELLAGAGGADAPEKIKRHLYRAWSERGARYALLVGDADVFPVRFMVLDRKTEAAFDTAFYPSDLYYADVADGEGAFDDWNGARRGHHATYWGEVRGEKHKDGPINHDGISYVPELAVGRWPVSTAEELEAVVAKTLAWVPRAEEPRALFVHAGGWVDARARVGRLADGLADRGWSAERLFYGGRGSAPSPPLVRGALLEGVELAVHVGHGTNEGWHGCLGRADGEALRAASPAVYFSVGCSTAHLCTEPPYHAYVDVHGEEHAGTNAGEVFEVPPPPPAPRDTRHDPPRTQNASRAPAPQDSAVCNTAGRAA